MCPLVIIFYRGQGKVKPVGNQDLGIDPQASYQGKRINGILGITPESQTGNQIPVEGGLGGKIHLHSV